MTLEDIRTLAQLVDEDIVALPKYLPPQFADLSAMTEDVLFQFPGSFESRSDRG